ncbi:MAG: exo-alpha-sialidase [Verrucomicrobiaceae bacterium]|nr:exo-alpha-sialidase [Verrucomicrobiaceae bacterium]
MQRLRSRKMQGFWFFFILVVASVSFGAGLPRIEWDAGTEHLLVPQGVYARMTRLRDGALLACSQSKKSVIVLRSDDEAKSWSAPITVTTYAHGVAANPDLCALADGSVLLFWNERPVPDNGSHKFTICVTRSTDGGRTWEPRGEPIFTGGNVFANACWEPSAVQMPDGEVRMFFAHELPGQQEILMMTSLDAGQTWSSSKQVSLRPKRRDGMPVPCLLKDGRLVFSIEDNGIAGQDRPHPPFRPTIVNPEAKDRWMALATAPDDKCNVAAPYLTRLPSGETLLAVQSNEDERRWHRMAVYVGDEHARGFTHRTLPFGLPPESNSEWNALCVLEADHVIALTSAMIQGKRGVWMVRGTVKR